MIYVYSVLASAYSIWPKNDATFREKDILRKVLFEQFQPVASWNMKSSLSESVYDAQLNWGA